MTKDAAVHSFFSSFGLTAYPAISVPTSGDEAPEFPYLTYNVSTDADMGRVGATASVYYRSESWVGINAKVHEISQAVGQGMTIACDDGGIVVRKATPWAQPMEEPSDNMVKKKVLSFEFLYATTY